jgi:hypothetical protein
MKGQQIVKCPQCEGNRVIKNDFTALLFLGALLVGWIPIIGWIAAVIFVVLGIVNLTKKGKRFTCQECKRGFRVSKEKYIEYKSYFN